MVNAGKYTSPMDAMYIGKTTTVTTSFQFGFENGKCVYKWRLICFVIPGIRMYVNVNLVCFLIVFKSLVIKIYKGT